MVTAQDDDAPPAPGIPDVIHGTQADTAAHVIPGYPGVRIAWAAIAPSRWQWYPSESVLLLNPAGGVDLLGDLVTEAFVYLTTRRPAPGSAA